jgi:hypothetical protein
MPHPRETLQRTGKAFAARDSTSSSRHTDLSFGKKNASDSILRKNESDSIETDERDLQKLKQEESTIATVRGMKMNAREELENASDAIARRKRSAPIQKITQRRWTGS